MSAPSAAEPVEPQEVPPAPPPVDDVPAAPVDQPAASPVDDEPPVPVDATDEEDDDEAPGPREETEEEILEPKTEPVLRELSDDRGNSRNYLQRDFLYQQQIAMYGLLGRAVKTVLEGESGLGMDDLFQMLSPKNTIDQVMSRFEGSVRGADDAPDKGDDTPEADLEQAAKILSAFSRLVSISPEIMVDFQCIVLDIPKGHLKWAVDQALPRVTREMGYDIMHTFIDQNWGILEGFFTEELPRLAKRAAQARRRHKSTGGQSKP